uniref:Integrase catalytic domain-containing protein n=1 Tax=Trichogramma kaykai TaxID=54128 RepID=A0ABD2W1X8_9HYME
MALWPVGNALVDNYVNHIQELYQPHSWRYVPSEVNPVDIATRGAEPDQLQRTSWFNGPAWLSGPPSDWPADKDCRTGTDRSTVQPTAICAVSISAPDVSLLDRFSSLTTLLRVIVRIKRWPKLLNSNTSASPIFSTPITAPEFKDAFDACVRLSQSSSLQEEIAAATHGRRLPMSSQLRGLAAFVDSNGILRIGGRLQYSDLPYEQKHPPILRRTDPLARLIVHWAHQRALHGGFRSTYSFAVSRAWIIGGKRYIQAFVGTCPVCVRSRARPMEQMMAPLPSERVTSSRLFARTGLDYAGPFSILSAKGRGIRTSKGYIVILVCLATKTIHLEVAGDLTTESLMGTLTRFCGRRGRPSEFWSDNATYFHAADRELRNLMRGESLAWGGVIEKLASEGIEWKFIPPRAPHFGGVWEAGVKLVKSHLRRVLGPRKLTFEELSTLLVSIESILNSRSLTPITGTPDDLDALTGGLLATGTSLTSLPDRLSPSDRPLDTLSHWQLVRGLRDRFWSRWSREYLNTLHQRHRWTQPRQNLQVGDLVVLLDSTLLRPDGRWPLGRVISVHPGKDGLVRTATVKTSTGTYQRSVTNLSILPLPESQDASSTATDSTVP